MKRAAIIMGAGAAKAWDALLTPELTEIILNDKVFLTKKGIPLAQYIYLNLTEFYGNSSGINFETIINTLESIQSYFMNRTPVGGQPNFVSSYSKWFSANMLIDDMMNFNFIPDTHVEGPWYGSKYCRQEYLWKYTSRKS